MIDSPANPTVKLLRSLESPKQIREHGLFLVEGVRAINDALFAGYWPHISLVNAELVTRTERGRQLWARLRAAGRTGTSIMPPQEASIRAIEAASFTQHPQGVVAAFNLVEWPAPSPPKGKQPLALVCDEIQDPGNLGTILRSAEAAGVTAVWLSPRCVDYYSPKVVRAAMGAHFRLPIYSGRDWPDIERELGSVGVRLERLYGTAALADVSYDSVDWTEPSGLIVSNEAHGLSQEARELLAGAGGKVSIPMQGSTESLNASIAAAVIVFEAARQRRSARPAGHRGSEG